ncbi:MAG: pyridoxamine 5'-phosphate oxidase family protein [Cyclobacteriaceae bacterium]|nr:pyridoxamine 5'-phosphate oxidase family protein [Cyclobacteriaceae bacterium]
MKKPTEKIRVKRVPDRGSYDKETIYRILDASFLCHMAFIHDGYPVIIPTLYGRSEENLYIHGATSSRMIKKLSEGIDLSLSVTLVDGFVLARSAFHHSMNYRSVVLFGKGELVPDEEKHESLRIISDHILPGRWKEVREPNKKELKATHVIRVPIRDASAKIRTGPPKDDAPDYDLDVWAGEIPLKLVASKPVADPELKNGIPASAILEELLKKYT